MREILILDEDYRRLKKWKYILLKEMSCNVDIPEEAGNIYIWLSNGELSARPHYAWNGANGPTIDTLTNKRATLFHDALCQLIEEGLLDKKYRKYADELLRQHIREDVEEVYRELQKKGGFKKGISGMYKGWNRFRANYWYVGVRGWSKLKGM